MRLSFTIFLAIFWMLCLEIKNLKVDLMPVRKTCKKFVAFLTNLHSWQEFYTTAGRGGRDKFQLCLSVN